MAKSPYSLTDLSPSDTFERHVYHRDQFAHYLRWTHILKIARIGQSIVDFGCGTGGLFEVMYRNRYSPSKYVGLDLRKSSIEKARTKFQSSENASFVICDLLDDSVADAKYDADIVCSFEVLEHVGKQNGDKFCQNFLACGNQKATYYLSTPNYDENVGAAGNHTYDSGDGRGVAVQEYSYEEIENLLSKYFDIEKTFGTFASQRDYKPHMNEWQQQMFEALSEYYDSNLISNIMAPLFPKYSRNTMWVLRRKQ